MTERIISESAIERRRYWTDEIVRLSGSFGDDFERVDGELTAEIEKDGTQAVLDHLRLSGAIPESYGRDSSEEKLYSKYTDALLANAFRKIGLQTVVLKERGDSADVEAVIEDYSFVADAKVFRLSRTAKNQKDFKVQAMHNWKRGKSFAIVVCPLYQLPSRESQIYLQAVTQNVCILSYAHLAVLVSLADLVDKKSATHLLHEILRVVQTLPPSKDALQYWSAINRLMLGYHKIIPKLWEAEKRATRESLEVSKKQALTFLASERKRMMRLSREEAIEQLLGMNKIENREEVIKSVCDNDLMVVSR